MKNVLIITLNLFYTIIGVGQNPVDTNILNCLINKAKISNSDMLVIFINDTLYYENYFGKSKEKIESMSITKYVVSLAVGKLIADRKIKSIDQAVCEFYPEWKQGKKDT